MKKNKYQVLNPIGLGGRRERGEVVEITEAEAKAIGSEYLKPLFKETTSETVEEVSKDETSEVENTLKPETTSETVEETPAKKGSKKGSKKN